MERIMKKRNLKGNTFLYVILAAFAVIMVLPYYWTLLTSIRHNQDMFSIPIKWYPTAITFEHYVSAFTTVPFARYFVNSLYLAAVGVFTNVFFGSLAGYAFAKLRFRGRNIIFKVFLASIMIPGVVTMIPQYLLLKGFPLVGGNNMLGRGGNGFLNTYWAIIIPFACGAFAVFLMRQFFTTLPDDLAESGRIEGAGEFRIFWNLYLPLTKPAVAALSIFTFKAGWDNFLWPMIILNNPDMYTIQMGLQAFSFNHATEYGPMMAGSVIATIPMFILFIFAQKYFVQGIAFSGIKG